MYSNPCIRCGKERIFVRLWEEKIGNSIVTTTETSCPDPECQKIVVKENKRRMEKLKSSQLRRRMGLRGRRKQPAVSA